MSCNVYGAQDHFDLKRAHVLSALVRRFVDAKDEGHSSITLWGKGMPRREFIHVDDVAKAILFLMELYESSDIINVGTDISIRNLADLIAKEIGYDGEIIGDSSKRDGMPRNVWMFLG